MEVALTPYRAKKIKEERMIFDEYASGIRRGDMIGPLKEKMCMKWGFDRYGLDMCIKREAVRRGLVAPEKPTWKVSMDRINELLAGGAR